MCASRDVHCWRLLVVDAFARRHTLRKTAGELNA